MNTTITFALLGTLFLACGEKTPRNSTVPTPLPIVGTWRLISGTTVEKGDTTVTDYTKDLSFIKLINGTHFAFLKHSLTKGAGAPTDFGAGGGTYTLRDSLYTEHLDYCNERQWEGNDFAFTITLQNDTLTQRGVEKIQQAGVNRLNIERYVRVKE